MNSDAFNAVCRDAYRNAREEGYKIGVEKVHAEIRENFIKAVHNGSIPLEYAKEVGFDVEEEMIQRDISIPDQDIVRIRFYKSFVERTMLSRGTQELLKIFTKDDVVIFFKRVQQFDEKPVSVVDIVIKNIQFDERYENDPYYRQGVEESRAERRELIIQAVHEGKMSLHFVQKIGYEVRDEMRRRGISIPDQDLLNISFYKNDLEVTIFDRGIKELLKIFTRDEVVDYLELIRIKTKADAATTKTTATTNTAVKTSEAVTGTVNSTPVGAAVRTAAVAEELLEEIISAINAREAAGKYLEEEAAHSHHDVSAKEEGLSDEISADVNTTNTDTDNATDTDDDTDDTDDSADTEDDSSDDNDDNDEDNDSSDDDCDCDAPDLARAYSIAEINAFDKLKEKDDVFSMSIKPSKRDAVEAIFEDIDLTLEEAVEIFFDKALLMGGMPFDVDIIQM